MLKDMVNKIKN